MYPDVHYNCALLDHVPGYALGVASSDHEDVGHAGDAGDVRGAEMADGNGSVGPGLFLEKKGGEGSADDEAATDHHYVLAVRVVAYGDQHSMDACGGAGHESGLAGQEPAYVQGVKALDVFQRVDGVDDVEHVDAGRDGELDEDAVEPVVVVEAFDEVQEVGFGGAGGELEGLGVDAGLLGGPLFCGDVSAGGGVIGDQDNGETRHHARLGFQLLDAVLNAQPDVFGDPAAIDNDGAHILYTHLPRLERAKCTGRDSHTARMILPAGDSCEWLHSFGRL